MKQYIKKELTEQEENKAKSLLAEYNAKAEELYEFYNKQLKYVTNGRDTLRVPELD